MKDPKENENLENEDILESVESDMDLDFDSEEDASFGAEKKLKKVKKDLKKCNEEKIDYLNSLQRLKADYVNLKKRNESDVSNLKDFISKEIISDFISVLDTFDMAFKDQTQWNLAPENWRKGVEYIHVQFKDALEKNHVAEIDQTDIEFDHELHDASGTVEVDSEKEDGTVKEILLKGYKYKDQVIRPAKIKVGKFEK